MRTALLKRSFDIATALAGLTAFAPALLTIAAAIWMEDRRSPFYLGLRMGRYGKEFRMAKFRTMTPDAGKAGVNSTAQDDPRITMAGRWLRRTKLDELPQLWNVLLGDMSVVGPRPQVRAETDLYTAEERGLLEVRPGITDLASIVFADEGEILRGSRDPDGLYRQIIRPWKSRLGLLYVRHFLEDRHPCVMDARILALTIRAMISRESALSGVRKILRRWRAGEQLERIALRAGPLYPALPPGADADPHSKGSFGAPRDPETRDRGIATCA